MLWFRFQGSRIRLWFVTFGARLGTFWFSSGLIFLRGVIIGVLFIHCEPGSYPPMWNFW